MTRYVHFRLIGCDQTLTLSIDKHTTPHAVERAIAGAVQLPPGSIDIVDSNGLKVPPQKVLDLATVRNSPTQVRPHPPLIRAVVIDPVGAVYVARQVAHDR
jgi:hypothetical protein